MDAEQRLLIDGELVAAASGRTYNNFSPVSELAIGVVSDAGYEDMDRAIGAARRVFDQSQWSRDHDFRHHCLTQLKDGLVADQARLRQARKMKTELHIEKQKRMMAENALIEAEMRLDTLADELEEQQELALSSLPSHHRGGGGSR